MNEFLETINGVYTPKDLLQDTNEIIIKVRTAYGYKDARLFKVGKKHAYKSTFMYGVPIIHSDKQRFLVFREGKPEWVLAKDLVVGEKVAMLNTPVEGKDTVPRDIVELIGACSGDGQFHYSSSKCFYLMFAPGDKEKATQEHYHKLFDRLGISWNFSFRASQGRLASGRKPLPFVRGYNTELWKYVRSITGEWSSKKDLRVPNWLFTQSLESRRVYLRALFSADGGFESYTPRKAPALVYTCSSDLFAREIVELLQSVGIRSYIVVDSNTSETETFNRIHVADIRRFVDTIGFLEEYKQKVYSCSKLRENQINCMNDDLRNTIVKYIIANKDKSAYNNMKDFYQHLNMFRYAGSVQKAISLLDAAGCTGAFDDVLHFNWNTFQGVEDLGYEVEMCDISVLEDDSNFMLNSVLTHNTAADILKMAFIRIDNVIKEKGYDVRLISTVHDEIVAEISLKEDILKVSKDLENAMNMDIPGFVPIKCEPAMGYDWGSLIELSDFDINKLDEYKAASDAYLTEEIKAPSSSKEEIKKVSDLTFTVPSVFSKIALERFKKVIAENAGDTPFMLQVDGRPETLKQAKSKVMLSSSLVQQLEDLYIKVEIPEYLLGSIL